MSRVTLDELRRLALEELDGDEWVSASGFALRLGLGGSYWYRVSLVCERLVSDGIAELRTGPNRKVRWFRLREPVVTTVTVSSAELAGAIDCRPADGHTAWANPFQVGRDGSSEQVAELYRRWLWREIRTGRPVARRSRRTVRREARLPVRTGVVPLPCARQRRRVGVRGIGPPEALLRYG
jgi:hypothetical protein